jgi:hypothetical protein
MEVFQMADFEVRMPLCSVILEEELLVSARKKWEEGRKKCKAELKLSDSAVCID